MLTTSKRPTQAGHVVEAEHAFVGGDRDRASDSRRDRPRGRAAAAARAARRAAARAASTSAVERSRRRSPGWRRRRARRRGAPRGRPRPARCRVELAGQLELDRARVGVAARAFAPSTSGSSAPSVKVVTSGFGGSSPARCRAGGALALRLEIPQRAIDRVARAARAASARAAPRGRRRPRSRRGAPRARRPCASASSPR